MKNIRVPNSLYMKLRTKALHEQRAIQTVLTNIIAEHFKTKQPQEQRQCH